MTPFQALYKFKPPQVAEMFLADEHTETIAEMLQRRIEANSVIKENLQQAQERMTHYANKNRRERTLVTGDIVYLKVQPYRYSSLSIYTCIKLHPSSMVLLGSLKK